MDQDASAFHSASSAPDDPLQDLQPEAAPDSIQDIVRAHLQPQFSTEDELQAFLRQQPEAQRARELATLCSVKLGVAALYVQRFLPLCVPDKPEHESAGVDKPALKSLLQDLRSDVQELKDASSAALVHSLLTSKQAAIAAKQRDHIALLQATDLEAWREGCEDGSRAGVNKRTHHTMLVGSHIRAGFGSRPAYLGGYVTAYKCAYGRLPRDFPVPEPLAEKRQGKLLDVQDMRCLGFSTYKPMKWALTERTRLALGDTDPGTVATSSTAVIITQTEGSLPVGLTLQGGRLCGTVASVQPYAFTIRAAKLLPGGCKMVEERTFEHNGIDGVGGGFGLPEYVCLKSDNLRSTSTNPMVPDQLLSAPGAACSEHLCWPAVAGPADWGNFTVGLRSGMRFTHLRLWSWARQDAQRVKRILIYGNSDAPIAEYGMEGRPPLQPPTSTLENWTELSSAVTLAIPAAGENERYMVWFQRGENSRAPGASASGGSSSSSMRRDPVRAPPLQLPPLDRAQLLDVADDAVVPAAMFLTAPVWEALGSLTCSRGAPVQHQLRANAADPEQVVTYALAYGAELPQGLELSASGVVSGEIAEEAAGGPGAGACTVCVRALVGANFAYAAATQEVTFEIE